MWIKLTIWVAVCTSSWGSPHGGLAIGKRECGLGSGVGAPCAIFLHWLSRWFWRYIDQVGEQDIFSQQFVSYDLWLLSVGLLCSSLELPMLEAVLINAFKLVLEFFFFWNQTTGKVKWTKMKGTMTSRLGHAGRAQRGRQPGLPGRISLGTTLSDPLIYEVKGWKRTSFCSQNWQI